MTALKARAWAEKYRRLVGGAVDDGPPGNPDPPLLVNDPATADPLVAEVLQELRTRARSMRDGGRRVDAALDVTWFERVPTGYCSTDVRPVEDETVVLVDDGLVWAVKAGSSLVARHYFHPQFALEHVSAADRHAFARVHDVFLGQYFLFGRAKSSIGLASGAEAVERRLTQECVAFVLAHELGHVVAGHRADGDSTGWLASATTPEPLHAFAPEIEADAIAVQLLLGDMWGNSVAEAEVDLRLLAMRLTLQTLETVEQCALVTVLRRHLPAGRRWEGVLNFLHRRFPATTLERFSRLWDGLAPSLRFGTATELLPPATSASDDALRHGWVARSTTRVLRRWDDLEDAVWQYRQPAAVLHAVIGLEIGQFQDPPVTDVMEARLLGIALTDEVLTGLPGWMLGGLAAGGAASAGDLVEHLRLRARWPEPFRSAEQGVLPIHLVTAAVHSELRLRLNAAAAAS